MRGWSSLEDICVHPQLLSTASSSNHQANVHSIDYLPQQGVRALTGEVECEKVNLSDTVTYDLK